MKVIVLCLLVGIAVGCGLTLFVSRAFYSGDSVSNNKDPELPTAVVDVEWSAKALQKMQSQDVRIKGRIWSGGYGLIHSVEESLDSWSNGVSPLASQLPQITVIDESFFTQEWWIKMTNGAACEIVGRISSQQPDQSNELACMDKVYSVKVLSGIPVNIDTIEQKADLLHGVVIRVTGVVGNHPSINSLFLYPNDDAWRAKDISKALVIERFFAAVQSPIFEPLSVAGTRMTLDALYQRPFKDDASAPVGRLSFIHFLNVNK